MRSFIKKNNSNLFNLKLLHFCKDIEQFWSIYLFVCFRGRGGFKGGSEGGARGGHLLAIIAKIAQKPVWNIY